jgi:ribonuclease J
MEEQNNIVMTVRPSMKRDLQIVGLHNGIFIYSLWNGYRDNDYQKAFEESLSKVGFESMYLHTSGHASVTDIKRVITGLAAKRIIPIHTMTPEMFIPISPYTEVKEDGMMFNI